MLGELQVATTWRRRVGEKGGHAAAFTGGKGREVGRGKRRVERAAQVLFLALSPYKTIRG